MRTTGQHLSLNIIEVFKMFFFIHTGLKSITQFIKSAVHNALQRASNNRCLMSVT